MTLAHAAALAAFTLVAVAGCSSCGGASSAGPGQQVTGRPVEDRENNGIGLAPAAPKQTRAPFVGTSVAVDVRRIAAGLDRPWGLAFLPDRAMLVTEKPGRLRVVSPEGKLSAPVAGVPEVDPDGQGGLLDVVLSPGFATDATIFFAYAEPRDGGNGTAVARARLVRGDAPKLEELKVIWRMTPTLDSKLHFGCRLVFAKDGHLFIATGERSIKEGRRQAQKLDSAFGKVLRVTVDGAPAPGNPFLGREGALPEIFTFGHRNIQGAALHPTTGELWVHEHGPKGGDEVNVVRAGRDYGWPTITYGAEYTGGKVGDGISTQEGMEQPIYYWDPSIAPSGMAFYEADLFPSWKGSLLVGALAGKHLARLVLQGESVVGEERLLVDRARIRDVRVGPEGAVYVLTDESDGEILALFPKK